MYIKLKKEFCSTINKYKLSNSKIEVRVTARTLNKEEALGNPIHDDYPLLKGKESIMEAEFCGSKGAAYSDMCGNYVGGLDNIVNLELKNNFTRAVFISTINAVLKHLGLIDRTEHCRNDGPVNCANNIKKHFSHLNTDSKVLLVGYQPRFAEVFTENYNTKIIDLNHENMGKIINGVPVLPEQETENCIDWATLLFVTSSTFVNGTVEKFINHNKGTIFYGVSGAGPTYLLDLNRYCYQ